MAPIAFVFIQATVLAVLGFFVLFAASHSKGLLKHLGNVLGIWVLAIALMAMLAGAFLPLTGARVYGMMEWGPPGMMNPFKQPPRLPTP